MKQHDKVVFKNLRANLSSDRDKLRSGVIRYVTKEVAEDIRDDE